MSSTQKFVDKFAGYMERKLSMNRRKGDENGWRSDQIRDLVKRAREELMELEDAIHEGAPPNEVWGEAADVGNFLMMVADVYEQRTQA